MTSILSSLRVRAVNSERIQDFKAIQETSTLIAFLFLTPDEESKQLLTKIKAYHAQMPSSGDQIAYIQLFHTGGGDHETSGVEFVAEGHDGWYVAEEADNLLQALRGNFSVQRSGPVLVVTDREGEVIDRNAEDTITARPYAALSAWIQKIRQKETVIPRPFVPALPKRKKKHMTQASKTGGGQPSGEGDTQKQDTPAPVVAFGQFIGWTGTTRAFFPSTPGAAEKPSARLAAPSIQKIKKEPVDVLANVKQEEESPEEHAAEGGEALGEQGEISFEEFPSHLGEKLLSRDPDFGVQLIEEDWARLCRAVAPGEIDYSEIATTLLSASLNKATRATIAARFLKTKPRDEKTPGGLLKTTLLALVQKTLEERCDHRRPSIIRVISRYYTEGLMHNVDVAKALTFLWKRAFKEEEDPEIGANCLFLLELAGRRLHGDWFWRPQFDYGELVLKYISAQELPTDTRTYCDELMAFRSNGWARIDSKFGKEAPDLTITTKFRILGFNKKELATHSVRIETYLETLEQYDITQALCAQLLLEYLFFEKFWDESLFVCREGFLGRLTGLVEALLILADMLEIGGLSDYISRRLYESRCPQGCATCCGRFFFSLEMRLKHKDYLITPAAWKQFDAIRPPTSLHSATYDLSAVLRALQ